MFTIARPSPVRSKLTCAILIAISLMILSGDANAQSQVCVRKVNTAPTPFNGVVATGTSTGTCQVATLWPSVAPVKFLPNVGSPEAFLYLAHNPTTNHLFIGFDLKGDTDLSDQDVVALVFDADNSGTFNTGDFSIKVKVSSLTPIATGNTGGNPANQCDVGTGAIDVLRHNGTEWTPITPASGVVQTKLAYDYENVGADPEHDIWNLAIDLTLGSDFILSSPTFRIGAYIFMDTGHHTGGGDPQIGTVLKWPVEMKDRTITDQNLFGIPATAATELAIANLNDACFDVNFDAPSPWVINGFVANAFDNRIIRNGMNTFKVTFNFDGPGTTTQPLTNTGTVRLALTPYRASGSGTAWIQDTTVDAANFNAVKSVEFNFDFSNPPASFGGTGDINFVCATMSLVDFQRNDNKSNDSNNVNHNEFTTSEYLSDFFVYGSGVPGLKEGESTTVFLRMEPNNDPVAAKSGGGVMFTPSLNPPWQSVLTLIALLMSLVISLLLLRRLKTRRLALGIRGYVVGMAMLSLILLSWQWSCRHKVVIPEGTSRWTVQNVAELGLKPVKGERNLYEMPIRFGEAKRVQLRFEGMELPYKTERHQFNPRGQEGNPNILRIPAKGGEVVTVVAFGEIDLDGPDRPLPPTSPTGRIVASPSTDRGGAAAVGLTPWLLTRGYYTPNEFAGALIGSFDNFETSFVVGRSSSIVVPPNASALSLAVNAPRGTFANITGLYDLFTIVTTAPATPTHTSIQGDATFHIPPQLELWDHLTAVNVYTYYPVIKRREDGTVLSQTLNPWGSAHFTVFDSHVGR
jgi:hypothetical protein